MATKNTAKKTAKKKATKKVVFDTTGPRAGYTYADFVEESLINKLTEAKLTNEEHQLLVERITDGVLDKCKDALFPYDHTMVVLYRKSKIGDDEYLVTPYPEMRKQAHEESTTTFQDVTNEPTTGCIFEEAFACIKTNKATEKTKGFFRRLWDKIFK